MFVLINGKLGPTRKKVIKDFFYYKTCLKVLENKG